MSQPARPGPCSRICARCLRFDSRPTGRFWLRSTSWANSSSGIRPRADPLRTIPGDSQELRALAFTPDSSVIAAAGKGKVIHLWDVVTGQEILTLEGHKAQINALAFSPDGSLLASCSHDGAVRLCGASSTVVDSGLTPHVRPD